jgi:SAM-dependent methyltransferase
MTASRLTGWTKARHMVASQGVGGLLEELSARLRHRLRHPGADIPFHVFRARDWDRRRGVETDDWVEVDALEIDSPNRGYAFGYVPTSHWSFRAIIGALRSLGVRPAEFELVDFGCGKGRVLFMALEAGFQAATGVEISPELARRAAENLRSYRGRRRAATVHCGDATAFPIPPGRVVLFLANPFKGPVLEAVARNIQRSFADHPRPMYIVYLFPRQESPFDSGPPFVLVESAQGRAIYHLRDARH